METFVVERATSACVPTIPGSTTTLSLYREITQKGSLKMPIKRIMERVQEKTRITDFWDVIACGLINVYRLCEDRGYMFHRNICKHLQGVISQTILVFTLTATRISNVTRQNLTGSYKNAVFTCCRSLRQCSRKERFCRACHLKNSDH
jgi:hypothetical protein